MGKKSAALCPVLVPFLRQKLWTALTMVTLQTDPSLPLSFPQFKITAGNCFTCTASLHLMRARRRVTFPYPHKRYGLLILFPALPPTLPLQVLESRHREGSAAGRVMPCPSGQAGICGDPKQLHTHSRTFPKAHALRHACPASCVGIFALRLATLRWWMQLIAEGATVYFLLS